MIYDSQSAAQTAAIAEEFAQGLESGDVICMRGGLGAGKTVFVQGLARGLGIKEIPGSPTFTIMNCYEGKYPFYHFDVYRIQDPDEMYEIGYEEYVGGDGICVIEWAELIEEILPQKRYEITIEKDYEKGDDFRRIIIERKD